MSEYYKAICLKWQIWFCSDFYSLYAIASMQDMSAIMCDIMCDIMRIMNILCMYLGHIYNLCISEGPITDSHPSLQQFCQLLEVILRKGLICKILVDIVLLKWNCKMLMLQNVLICLLRLWFFFQNFVWFVNFFYATTLPFASRVPSISFNFLTKCI